MDRPIYHTDTRPEFKMWGAASKTSVCFSGNKSININLTARLSVVYVTKFILQCDKDFYKYKPESLINSKPAIAFFLK